MRTRILIVEIIAALLVLMFLYASVVKLLHFRKFIDDMNNQPFPGWTTPFLVWGVPLSELAISIALLFGRTRKIALYASAALMAVFTAYIMLILAHVFPYVPCSCGGVIEGFTWWQHLFFNLFFLAISIIGILLIRKTINNRHKPLQSVIA